MTAVYIHIPFCAHICFYCDFPKKIAKQEEINLYLDALYKEIKMYDKLEKVSSIYIGGGTPSSLTCEQLSALRKIRALFSVDDDNFEFTLECNPEDITEEKIACFKTMGVNRISLGVQTFNDKLLKLLNRKHSRKAVIRAVNLLRDNGFKNINIDLMFALPYQKIKDIKADLRIFNKLHIPHLSYYSLILEEKTVFWHKHNDGLFELTDNDIEAKMYEVIMRIMRKKGFYHYEISNFCLPGYASRHNSVYWENRSYYGFGAGASGYINRVRYDNEKHVKEYIKKIDLGRKPIASEKYIDRAEEIKETFLLGLRLIQGLDIDDVNKRFNINVFDYFQKELSYLQKIGLITADKRIKLSRKGLFFANEVFEQFI